MQIDILFLVIKLINVDFPALVLPIIEIKPDFIKNYFSKLFESNAYGNNSLIEVFNVSPL